MKENQTSCHPGKNTWLTHMVTDIVVLAVSTTQVMTKEIENRNFPLDQQHANFN